jgi:glycosyltransferase involved in cell wall biosynthesis
MEVTPPHKVLYAITKANWGGAQKYVYDLATAAKARGFEVVVAYGEEGLLVERLAQEGVRTVRVAALRRDVSGFGEFTALIALWRLFRSERPDIVHLNSSKAGFTGAIAGRLAGVPRIIFTAHGWAFNEPRSRLQKNFFALLHHLTILATHITICNSQSTYRDVACMPGVRGRLRVIYNGVSQSTLHAREGARAHLAPKLKETFWLGTLAELHRVKGLDVAIEAFAQVATQLPDTALVLMGEGEERERLTALSQQLGVSSRVHFCGYVENGPSYLSAFDIFLMPSRSESFGYVVAEAGLAHVPVIASRVGGIPEIITDGSSGILVPQGNAVTLAGAIEKLYADADLRTRLSSALYARVTENFSKEGMLEKTFALYNS